MQAENIKILSFGCRLNSLESEKIRNMLAPLLECSIVVNTCSVTAEAERQSAQAVRKLSRENPNAPIFVTGCAATRNPGLFADINNVIVIDNRQKMNLDAYSKAIETSPCYKTSPKIHKFRRGNAKLSKRFVQIQNGCNHACTYCVTRLLRGQSTSFEYETILADVKQAIDDGFYEIVLTGVDIASFARTDGNNPILISDLCKKLLKDVPEIRRMRLSSMDPASPEILKIIEIMRQDSRMMPHMHLSMQSGSDIILAAMGRRHNTDMVREIMNIGNQAGVSFSWDIICGFPGETEVLFKETCDFARKTEVIKVHAFPFSPRPDTVAAKMPNQINRAISKARVLEISNIAEENKQKFMSAKIGHNCQVLIESGNIAKTPDDIPVRINGIPKPEKTICNISITDVLNGEFIADVILG